MRRIFGKPLSIALSGALAVSSLSMTIPMTAFAADLGKVAITFSGGTDYGEATVAEGYAPLTLDEADYNTATIPTAATVFGSAFDPGNGYHVEWADGDDVPKIFKAGAKYVGENEDTSVKVAADGDGKAGTLTAKKVGNDITLGFEYGEGGKIGASVTQVEKKVYKTNLEADAIKEPTRPGYTFEKWHLASADAEAVTTGVDDQIDKQYEGQGYKNKVTLTAGWTADTYNWTYSVGAGAKHGEYPNTPASSKTYASNLQYAIMDPTYDSNHTFGGWDLNNNGAYDKDVDIPAGATLAVQSDLLDKAYVAKGDNFVVTAIWLGDEYSVQYDGAGMKAGDIPANTTISYDELTSATIGDLTAEGIVYPTRTGYSLLTGSEWSLYPNAKLTDDDYADNTYDADGTATAASVFKANGTSLQKDAVKDKAATLYLNWQEDSYTVILDKGTATTFSVSTNNKKNHWKEATDTTVPKITHADDTTATETEAVTEGSYYSTVKFTGSIELPTFVDDEVIDTNNEFTAVSDGKEFVGWATTAELAAQGKTDVTKTTVTIDQKTPAVVHYYPVFKAATTPAVDYKVSFDGNGNDGDDEIDDVEVAGGTKINLPTSGYVKAGYTLSGWRLGNATSGTLCELGAEVEVTGAATYYAQWDENEYTLSFYNGTQLVSQRTVGYGDEVALPPATSGNNIYLGWDTDATAVNPKYQKGTKVSQLSAVDGGQVSLYSIFATSAVTVTYDTTNALGTAGDKTFTQQVAANNSFEIADNEAAEGYEFVGWTTTEYASYEKAEEAHATYYKAGDSYTAEDKPLAFFAVYKAATLTVAFDGNGSKSPAMPTITATYNGTKYLTNEQLPENTYTFDGYVFAGWGKTKADADAGTNLVSDKALKGQEVVKGAETTAYYASWTPNSYRLTFDANGGTGSKTAIVSTVAKPATQAETRTIKNEDKFKPSDETVVFGGWSLSPDASLAEFPDGVEAYKVAAAAVAKNPALEDGASIIVYATWILTPEASQQKLEDAEAKIATATAQVAAATAQIQESAVNDAKDAAELATEVPTTETIAALEKAIQAMEDAGVTGEDLTNAKAALASANEYKAAFAAAVAAEDEPTEENIEALEAALENDKLTDKQKDALAESLEKAYALQTVNELIGDLDEVPTQSQLDALQAAIDAAEESNVASDKLSAANKALAAATEAAKEQAEEDKATAEANEKTAKDNEKKANDKADQATKAAETAKANEKTANDKAADATKAAETAKANETAANNKATEATKAADAAKADAATQKATADKATADLAAANQKVDSLTQAAAAKKYVAKKTVKTDDKKYTVRTYKNGTAMLKKVANAKGKVTLPKTVTVKGVKYTVTSLAAKAFYNNTTATQVVVPSTYAKIGKLAFGAKKAKTTKFKKITVQGSNVFVGEGAFKNVPNTKKSPCKIVAKNAATRKQITAFGGQGKNVKVSAK